MSRKAAVRRQVISLNRSGEWGEVTYHHTLSCGHIEVRKRPAKGTLTCSGCIAVDQLAAVARTGLRPMPAIDYDAAQESLDDADLTATIAATFDVDPMMVQIHHGERGQTATVFLDTTAVARFR